MGKEQLQERIDELEAELKNTKVNKRTEMAVGQLKAKIAKLKEELETASSKGKKGEGYAVKKEGDATVGLLGKPSVGKSTLLSKITNKESKIVAYEFTTLEVVPGLLHHKHTNLQILDLPGIINRASDNRGFGKKVLSVVRACDLVIFILDARCALKDMKMLTKEVHNSNLRVNKQKPFIEFRKLFKGGVQVPINKSVNKIPYELIKEVVNSNGYVNVEVLIHEENRNIEDLLEALYGNVVYSKAMICLNKIDLISKDELIKIKEEIKTNYPLFPFFEISAESGINLEEFKDFVWKELGFIWIYLKEQKKEPDFKKPLVLKRGDSIKELCKEIHKDLLKKFKYAKVKGSSVKFDWQRVGLEHNLKHEDVVEIYAR